MAVPGNSAQSWRAAFTGSYDDGEIDLLIPFIQPHSLVLDVGASLGFYTIPLAVAARTVGARVVAIEPVSGNCEIIRHNVALNGLEDVVTVLQCALGAIRTSVTLHIESGGTGNATIVTGLDPLEVERHDRAGKTRTAETVQVRPLDGLDLSPEDSDRRCSLIKVDTEGFEMEILEGAKSFITAHRPVILGEFSPLWLDTRGLAASAPADWATHNGYLCQELVHTRSNPLSDVRKATLMPLIHPGLRSGTDLLLLPLTPGTEAT